MVDSEVWFQEHDKVVTAMREVFEQMATGTYVTHVLQLYTVLWYAELQAKHEKKMVAQRDELELRRKAEIHEVEEVSLSPPSPY